MELLTRYIKEIAEDLKIDEMNVKQVQLLTPGKKRKRIEIVETDWREYTGSSTELNNDIKIIGKDKFSFEIIKFCNSKWESSFWEAKTQFDNNVLLRDDYYNAIINCRIGKVPKNSQESCSCILKITE